MLFGWLVPNSTIESSKENVTVIDQHYSLDRKMKNSKSNIFKLYSHLINKSSGKNIVKIKSLLNEFQQALEERRLYRQSFIDDGLDMETCEQIACLEHELADFCHKWIHVSKQSFEFMNFLVDLERIGDTIRLLIRSEEVGLQHYQLPQAV